MTIHIIVICTIFTFVFFAFIPIYLLNIVLAYVYSFYNKIPVTAEMLYPPYMMREVEYHYTIDSDLLYVPMLSLATLAVTIWMILKYSCMILIGSVTGKRSESGKGWHDMLAYMLNLMIPKKRTPTDG